MLQLLETLLSLIRTNIPLIGDLATTLGLALLLQKSIKKHPTAYYGVFAVITVALLWLMYGLEPSSRAVIRSTPVVSEVFRMFTHMAGFGFPLLIIIMYMGALDTRHRWVARLMSIRQELSILCGFPVLLHAWIRVSRITPVNLRFIFGGELTEGLQNPEPGFTAGVLTHTAFFLGIFMTVLFLILWVTSFSSIRRAMGHRRWKQVQRWAYLLYTLLFLHSTLLHTGWMLSTAENVSRSPHIVSLCTNVLIFGSYLTLRLRKARKDNERRKLKNPI